MKLIVDIPEEELQHIYYIANSGKELPVGLLADLIRIAANGIPQEPCDDVVSRQAVLEIAKQHTLTNDYLAIQNLPSVRPQEQIGHWKRISMDRYTTHAQYWYECDKCGEHNLGNTDFCPYCGCRMVDPQESEVRND